MAACQGVDKFSMGQWQSGNDRDLTEDEKKEWKKLQFEDDIERKETDKVMMKRWLTEKKKIASVRILDFRRIMNDGIKDFCERNPFVLW